MTQNDLPIKNAKVLVLGITFKENCPDIRNSRAIDVIRELQSFGADVEVYDSHADVQEVKHEYGLSLISTLNKKYSAIVLAVSHEDFKSIKWSEIKMANTIVYDVKGFLDKSLVTGRL
jgi:UDP-N-acetyl-D-galactosamine dehydrogenase